jgi:transcriptional regulator with XRE-family HTH domain
MNINRLLKKWEKELGPLTFGSTLRNFRECEEESLSTFAKKLGISKGSLSDLETGKRIPTPKRVAQISKALGYSEKCLIELAIRDNLKSHGLKYNVKLEKTA